MREDALFATDDEDDRVFEALGVVQRHQGDQAAVVATRVGVADQGDLGEKGVQPGLLAPARSRLGAGVELARDADELLEVLDPPLCLEGPLGFERLEIAAAGEHRLEQLADRRATPRQLAQLRHRVHEARECADRGAAQPRHAIGRRCDLPYRLTQRRRVRDHPRERGLPDPAPRAVGDADEAHLVRWVSQQREVGDRVLDLGPFVELRAADHLVGDLGSHERVLEHPRLGVGAVEDGNLRARHPLVEEPLDRAEHVAGLGVLVGQHPHLDRVALAQLGPQRLRDLVAVVPDHGVGGGEDRLRRAVVLLELDDMRVGEVLLEVEDVADIRSAESVDRLRVIADHREIPPLAAQQRQPAVLGMVGVLVLVDQHVAEGLLVALANLGEQLKHVDRAHQQIVEVHRVEPQQLALIELVGVGDGLLEVGADHRAILRRVAQAVLRIGDVALNGGRREALRVGADPVQALLDQPPRVGLVIDRELARVA